MIIGPKLDRVNRPLRTLISPGRGEIQSSNSLETEGSFESSVVRTVSKRFGVF